MLDALGSRSSSKPNRLCLPGALLAVRLRSPLRLRSAVVGEPGLVVGRSEQTLLLALLLWSRRSRTIARPKVSAVEWVSLDRKSVV